MLDFFSDTTIEYLGVLLSLIYVFLATKEIKWCWVAGGIGSAIYVYLNFKNNLVYDAVLQLYYVVVAIYALLLWNNTDENNRIVIANIKSELLYRLLSIGVALTAVFGYYSFSFLHQSTAFLDAGVTAFSFVATWMTAKKYVESWLLWIVIDVAAAIMYGIKGLYPTVGLYVVFAAVAVYAYFEWKRLMALNGRQNLQ